MKRLLSLLISISMLLSLIPASLAAGDIEVAFPQKILSVGSSAALSISGASGATLHIQSSDSNVLHAKDDGTVTAFSIGNATVTVTADFGGGVFKTDSVEIAVVGENLFNSRGVDNGSFAGGSASLFKDQFARFYYGFTKLCKPASFWAATTESAYAQTADVVPMASAVNPNANVLKYSRTTEAANKQIAIRTSEFKPATGYQYGAYLVDHTKLYEFTGWMNFDDMTNAPSVTARVNHGTTPDDKTQITKYGDMASANGGDGKNSETSGWQYFNTSAYDMHLISESVELYAVPQLSSGKSAWTGDFYFADASFHEVKYSTLDFELKEGSGVASVGDTLSTTVAHFSNTGKEIISFNASGTKQSVPVTYATTNSAVATVSNAGVISVVGEGTADITATATLGETTLTSVIPITATDENVLHTVSLSADNQTVWLGETGMLSVSGTLRDGTQANLSGASINFTSDNTSILTVDANGKVTPVSVGNANVKAEVTLDGVTRISYIDLCVEEKPPVKLDSVKLDLSENMLVGESEEIAVSLIMNDGSSGNLSDAEITYSSADEKVAKVSRTGKVTAISAGTTEIRATVTLGGGTKSAAVKLTVMDDPDGIKLQFKAKLVNVGDTAKVEVLNAERAKDIAFTTSDGKIAVVDENGNVTGINIGRVTITATADFGGNKIKTASIEIPVVGENILDSRGVDQGTFDGGRFSLQTGAMNDFDADNKEQFWWVPAVSVYAEKVAIVNGESYGSKLSNLLKVTRENVSVDNQIIVATDRYANKGGQSGGFVLDNSKIYEFTGWVNQSGVTNAPALSCAVFQYFGKGEDVYGALSTSYRVAPSGDGEWESFNTTPFDISDVEIEITAQPRINSGKSAWTGSFYFADFSFHEVEFDKVSFTPMASMGNLKVGDSITTTAVPLSTTGMEIKSFDAAGKAKTAVVSYASSDETVATVAPNGTITVTGEGVATITASITLGSVMRSATLPVCVVDGVAPEKAELFVDKATLAAGETAQSTVKLVNNDETYADISDAEITFSSQNPSVAEVDEISGVITAISEGTANVIVNVLYRGASYTAVVQVKVVSDELRSLRITTEDLLQPGETCAADVKLYSADGKVLSNDDYDITYVTSDEAIASVESYGMVNAHMGGVVTITAYASKDGITVRGKTRLVVNYLKDVSLTVNEPSLEPGDKSDLSVSLAMYDGQEIDTDDCTLSYQSSDDGVAYVDDDGKVLAVGDGECYITAYATYEDVVAESSAVKISVYDTYPLVSAELTGPASVKDGSWGQFAISGTLESGQEVDIPLENVTFEIVESYPENAVTVDANGVVRGVEVGYATIRAKVTYRGAEDLHSNAVTVNVTEGTAEEIMIDFRASYTPSAATMASNGWTINYELSRNSIATSLERHELYGVRATFTGSWINGMGTTTNRFAFDFNVPTDGIYRVEYAGAGSDMAGINSIFIDGKFMGTYSHRFETREVQMNDPKTLNTIELSSGIHTVLIGALDITGSTKGNVTYPYITYVKLTPVDEMPVPVEVSVDEENITLAVGEIAEIDAALIMSNGEEYGFGADYKATEAYTDGITFTTGDNGIISVDESTGKIRALSAGDAKVTVTAKLGNDSFTKEVSVTVTDEILSVVTAKVKNKTVFVDEAVEVEVEAILEPGRRVTDNPGVEISYVSMTPNTVTVEGGVITAIAAGYGQIKVIAKLGKITKEYLVSFEVFPSDFDKLSLFLSAGRYYVLKNIGSIKLIPQALTNLGKELDLSEAEITFKSSNPDIAPINEAGEITLNELGKVTFTVEVSKNGIKRTESLAIEIVDGKSEPTYHTMQMRESTLSNISKYDWAKDMRDNAVEKADKYVEEAMKIRTLIEPEGLPRSTLISHNTDPEAYSCAYCKTDCRAEYGLYPWIVNPLVRPWKIQCPECKRIFPSNDFQSYYELGLDEYGKFDAERARNENQRLIDSGFFASQSAERQKNGYLANDLYPEKGEGWGVDDGWGFLTGKTLENGLPQRISFIAYYLHDGLWVSAGSNQGLIAKVIPALQNAYIYTGDKKYGKAGILILDRIADLYPDYYWNLHNEFFYTAHGGSGYGKITGVIREPVLVDLFTEAYDAFYPLTEDEEIISILSAESKKYGLDNSKTNAWLIRQHFEDNFLREAYDGIRKNLIAGNFGKYQSTLSQISLILDHYPESKEMIDWILQPGEAINNPRKITGGNLLNHLMSVIDRDGHPQESPAYNIGQLGRILPVADNIAMYDDYAVADVYKNPKFFSMFDANIRLSKAKGYAQIGDGHYTASVDELISASSAASYFMKTGIIELAQYAYNRNGNSVEGLYGDIYDDDPEAVQKEILKVIEEHGELDLPSEMLTGFGFSILRSGKMYDSVGSGASRDTRKNVWMFWNGNESHTHADALDIGIEAFGISMAPELGYPEQTGDQPNRGQWISATLSHNTVSVVGENQQRALGVPVNFDDSGKVSVMEVDSSNSYIDVDIYRRAVVSIELDEDTFYAVDFFRVKGGDDHIYSFHAQSDEIYATEGLELKPQVDRYGNPKGTYAGLNVPFGQDPTTGSALTYHPGFTWLENVRRAQNVSGNFSVDFKIKDYRKILPYSMNLHMKMTMVNDKRLAEVALATGYPPNRAENKMISSLEYVLVRRKGTNLDSMFTTVFEPYRDTSKIEEITGVEMVVSGNKKPGKTDVARAVKVKVSDERTDYIVYSTNHEVTYTVGGLFEFSGCIGVLSVDANNNVLYRYVNDGTNIAGVTSEKCEITGKVDDFTKELQLDNSITITTDTAVSPESLVGRYIYINNTSGENGVYKIYNAEDAAGGKTELDIGKVTLVNRYEDPLDMNSGFVYNIEDGNTFRIPLSYEENFHPVFEDAPKGVTTSAGSSVKVTVRATADESTDGRVTYSARQLPRGASVDAVKGTVTWKPDSSQVGENLVAIDAIDEYGRTSTIYFTITVYGSTTGGSSSGEAEKPSTGTAEGSSGGGGGGGGAPTDKPDNTTNTDIPDASGESGEGEKNEGNTDNTGTENSSLRFTDLGNYSWAADAINSLAEDGIIKGTTASTYSPASNITRADFALLLVRAFNLESDNTENFADVSVSDYFAPELAIARNTGIVGGIGENKYAPRNNITRQDMMVIVYRALQKLGVEFGENVEPQYSDFDSVADYASGAVKALITSGFINGKNGKIAPTEYTTRAEVAVLVKRIVDYLK